MAGKDVAKLAVAVGVLGVAVVLFIVRSKSGDDAGDESKTAWYCTKTQKGFEISGDENLTNVRTGRRASNENAEGGVGMQRSSDIVTVAKSPFTNDWTGVPAAKCGDCKEIYPLDLHGTKENLCPKCQWNPNTGRKGPSGGEAKPADGKGE